MSSRNLQSVAGYSKFFNWYSSANRNYLRQLLASRAYSQSNIAHSHRLCNLPCSVNISLSRPSDINPCIFQNERRRYASFSVLEAISACVFWSGRMPSMTSTSVTPLCLSSWKCTPPSNKRSISSRVFPMSSSQYFVDNKGGV